MTKLKPTWVPGDRKICASDFGFSCAQIEGPEGLQPLLFIGGASGGPRDEASRHGGGLYLQLPWHGVTFRQRRGGYMNKPLCN
jgi:hypothetical protein